MTIDDFIEERAESRRDFDRRMKIMSEALAEETRRAARDPGKTRLLIEERREIIEQLHELFFEIGDVEACERLERLRDLDDDDDPLSRFLEIERDLPLRAGQDFYPSKVGAFLVAVFSDAS